MKTQFSLLFSVAFFLFFNPATAQIDFNNINPADILGKVIKVDKGFSPKFFIGNVQIPKVDKLGEILSMKHNDEINRLYKTFKTGRTIFKIASYTGAAVAAYGIIRKIDAASENSDYKAALVSGAGAIGTGIIIKLLTKGASYKAVDIFNNTVRNKIKEIFKIGAASNTLGVGLYVKL